MTSKTNRTSKTSPKTAPAQTAQTEQTKKENPMTTNSSSTNSTPISHIDAVLMARAMAQAWKGTTAQTESKPKTRKPKAEKVERPCLCGCGRMTKSAFAPGHDAKSKSAMRAIAHGQPIRVDLGTGMDATWKPSAALVTWAKEHGWDETMTPLARDKHTAKAQHVTSAVRSTSTTPDAI